MATPSRTPSIRWAMASALAVALAMILAGLLASPRPQATPASTPTPAHAAQTNTPVQPGDDEPRAALDATTDTSPMLDTLLPPGPDGASSSTADGTGFGFQQVIDTAAALSQLPFDETGLRIAEDGTDLDYDSYRRIEYKAESALTFPEVGDAYKVLFDPAGFLFRDRIAMNLVRGSEAVAFPYRAELFRFFDLPLSAQAQGSLGFAGFRVLTPLNEPGKFDELISFKGASFFRALGQNSRYGTSARGLALATASPDGEEFPVFRTFWIDTPNADQSEIGVYALLDGASITGAYHFRIRPGVNTEVDVEAVLFPRRELDQVGIAPLTSMFDLAPQDPEPTRQDIRPRVHDAEALSIHLANGEHAWRPLTNPARLQMSSLADAPPLSFGLVQRERRFAAYDDLEALYHLRPSVWVTPRGTWPDGELVLVEIPTSNEFNDNIVTFWRPKQSWPAHVPVRLAYTLHWGNTPATELPIARIAQTRTGLSVNSERRVFLIDLESGNPEALADARPVISASTGRVLHPVLTASSDVGGARLTFELEPDDAELIELRMVLMRGSEPVSETWLYRWTPP